MDKNQIYEDETMRVFVREKSLGGGISIESKKDPGNSVSVNASSDIFVTPNRDYEMSIFGSGAAVARKRVY